MDRRDFLFRTALAAGAGLVGGCRRQSNVPERRAPVPSTGRVREYRFAVAATDLDLGDGHTFRGYNASMPGPEIRVGAGDTVRVAVQNELEEATTIHWHGLPVPNRMDGVPDVTQEPIPPGRSFTYEFVAYPAGTYVYHSHAGYQLDQGCTVRSWSSRDNPRDTIVSSCWRGALVDAHRRRDHGGSPHQGSPNVCTARAPRC
jgi:FtsP/CotA-like multicopper oxidase with cupredoxin domain